jgi:hypothetical protein
MLVNRSTNSGRSWSDPITLIETDDPRFLNDKNSITADPTNARYAYAVWDRIEDFTLPPDLMGGGGRGARARAKFLRGQAKSGDKALEVIFKGPALLARTTNGGRSWEKAKVIYDPGPNSQTVGNQIVVTPNGTIIDFFDEIFPNGELNLALLRSSNKGRSFEARPTYVAHLASSLTGTITPDEQLPVRDAIILFDVAVDPRSGVLYAVWQDTRFRGVDEAAFSLSMNGGSRWTRPIRVNQTPADRNRLRQQAFVPSVEVAPDGSVVVTYYDFRNDNTLGELTDYWAVFCRANCDSATSWGNELRLTERSFDMRNAPVAGGRFLGDYMGLERAGDAVYPVFGIATARNRTDLFTRRIVFDGGNDVASATP